MFKEDHFYKFGSTTIAKVNNSDELRQLLVDPLFDCSTIIVKPNWLSTDAAEFTDAESMKMLFEALDSRIIVVESYSLPRSLNLLERGKSFSVGDKVVDWKWLMKGSGWRWLTDHPDWDWFKREGHWDQLREEDKAFRDKHGFTDLFREFDVTYLNVTEEVWNGRIADPANVKQAVESRFKPVHCERLYSLVPQKLYDLRGSTFISLARLKMYASFTFKNVFGMIPDPLKTWWHGPGNSRITASVVDINKIYQSLFNVYGICEALNTTAFLDPEGKFKGIFSGRYNVVDGGGVIALGRDLIALDAILLNLSDPSRRMIEEEAMRMPIDQADEEFGAIDRKAIEDAMLKVKRWISP